MIDQTCKSCKWWNVERFLGFCDSEKFKLGYNLPGAKDDEVVIMIDQNDADDMGGAFFVGADFGCIHWEQ